MVTYLFENEKRTIKITISAPSLETASEYLSDKCKGLEMFLVSNYDSHCVNTPIVNEYKPLGLRLNNPLNIRYNKRNKWVGLKGEQNGFCDFFSPVHGFRAALRLLCNYVKSGYDTIEAIISRFAPLCENDTLAYIRFVSFDTGFSSVHKISNLHDVKTLCWSMCKYELGYKKLSVTQLEVLSSCLYTASVNYKYPIS